MCCVVFERKAIKLKLWEIPGDENVCEGWKLFVLYIETEEFSYKSCENLKNALLVKCSYKIWLHF